MSEIDFDRPRITFCRKMAQKAFGKCAAGFPEGFPRDLSHAVPMVLPGFEVFDLENLPQNVSGIVSIEDRAIGVNQSHPKEQQRFTIAHEIGHIFLSHPHNVFDPTGKENAAVETEANVFAYEFLVPSSALKRAFLKCRNYEELASQFTVTREVMYYRFKSAKLLPQVL